MRKKLQTLQLKNDKNRSFCFWRRRKRLRTRKCGGDKAKVRAQTRIKLMKAEQADAAADGPKKR